MSNRDKVPETRREDFRELIHGVEVADPYRWLEDGNSDETRAWIAAQQKYTAPFLKTPARERIHRRLTELMKIEAVGIPIERRDQYFFLRRNVDQQQSVICHRRGLDGADEVLIDPNPMSADHNVSVDILDATPDGALLAYAVRHGGEDEHEIRVIDVASRSQLADVLPRAISHSAAAISAGRNALSGGDVHDRRFRHVRRSDACAQYGGDVAMGERLRSG